MNIYFLFVNHLLIIITNFYFSTSTSSSVIQQISNLKKNMSKCVINSDEYSNEYLTSNMSIKNDKQSIYSPYLISLSKIDNLNDIAWDLVSVINTSKSIHANYHVSIDKSESLLFFMRTYRNKRYLCASDSHRKIFIARFNKVMHSNQRILYTTSKRSHIGHNCVWKLERLLSNDDEDQKYKIINVENNEILFADSDMMKFGSSSHQLRHIYLWPKLTKPSSSFSSKRFIWNFECKIPFIGKIYRSFD